MCPFGIRLPILEPKVVVHEDFARKLKTKKFFFDDAAPTENTC